MGSRGFRRTGVRLATRGSPLAMRQAEEVGRGLAGLNDHLVVEPVVVRTRGDRLAEVSLDRIGGQGAFVKEVQLAVLGGKAEVAVHSAKDLPAGTPEGLRLACVPRRADPRDALVGKRLDDVAAGGVVATGSARRRAQLANLRPDVTFVELRGNVGTRLEKADNGTVDAVVTAVAALGRLGEAGRAAEVLPPSVVLPQVGQGALALECREDDEETAAVLALLDDEASHRCLDAERSVLETLGASCAAPFGALGQMTGGSVHVEAVLASADGRIVVRSQAAGGDPVEVGRNVAISLVEERGAGVIEGVASTGREAW